MIFQLSEEIFFPPVELSEPDGILAVGGDLSPERLLLAYSSGIFPWYNPEDPIIWWSPDPRFVLYPDEVSISKTMRKVLRQKRFKITIDNSFPAVIAACGKTGRKRRGTWITKDMLSAYCELHRLGFAHSVEAWQDETLVGGLYGVSLGNIFFGESMFSKADNASKACFLTLSAVLNKLGFCLIDSQVANPHMESLGGVNIPRFEYLKILAQALENQTFKGNWGAMEDFQKKLWEVGF